MIGKRDTGAILTVLERMAEENWMLIFTLQARMTIGNAAQMKISTGYFVSMFQKELT